MKTNLRFLFLTFILLLTSVSSAHVHGAERDSIFAEKTTVVTAGGNNMVGIADEGACGITNYLAEPIEYEAFAGLKVKTNGTNVKYTMYSHTSNYTQGDVKLQPYSKANKAIDLGTIKVDETKSFDLKNMISSMNLKDTKGIYQLTISCSKDSHACTNLYYDGHNVKFCRLSKQTVTEIEAWNKLIGGLDPKTCLDLYVGNKNNPITYPTSGQNGNCNHVQEWCDLSDKVILHDDWSDEAKVWALVLNFARNYAYDDYRVDTLNNTSRAMTTGVWNDDNLWMYYNGVGQCWDFANAMTIMCRHHGIPCTTVENNGHTVNAVWLCGEWVAIDISALVQRHCKTLDTNSANWVNERQGSYTYCYGYYDSSMNSYNQAIATPETTLTNRSGKNPM